MTLQGLRWWVVSLVAIATVINYIDRSALAIMWPGIAEELGMDKSDYANIVTVFMIAYAIGQSLFGKIFDWLGTRMGFVLSIGVWSLSIALHAVAHHVLSFALFRFLLGLGEAGNWPGATKANAEWFPVKERALAQGIFNAGASVGSIIAPPLIAYLYVFVGWQTTFILIGAFGLLWLIPWLALYKAGPERHPWITAEERHYILTGQKVAPIVPATMTPPTTQQNTSQKNTTQSSTTAPMPVATNATSAAETADTAGTETEYVPGMRQLLRHRQSWSLISARFFIDPVWWLFVAWLPIYLNETFGFNVQEIGAFAWVPYVGAAIGAIFGGWWCGKLLGRGYSVNKARRTVIVAGALVMLPALIATVYANTPQLAVGLIGLILFGFQVMIGNIQTLPSDYFSGKSVGSLSGISGTAAVISVILTIQLVPLITASGNYAWCFALGAVLVPLSVLSVFMGGTIQPVAAKKAH